MIDTMQEILANTVDASKPLSEQQFYELTLLDPEPDVSNIFRVRQAHVRWDEQVAGMIWDKVDWEEFPTLEQAREGFERRRRALVDTGFSYSDLDL
jgi:hypothetical protein